jgi:DNA-binding beta-propeller fold protein YncE
VRHCSTIVLLALIILTSRAYAQEGMALRLVQTIPLPHVEGRIDHLAVDLQGQRLFVAALGNNTLEVLDLKAGTRLHTITGLHEPQGVVFIPESNTIVVTNGQTGTCDLFDGTSFQHRNAVKLASDADNIRYDVATHTLYVGYGAGALGLIDATRAKHLGDIPLKGHPEAFQLEQAGSRIFVNIPSVHYIAVVDRDKRAVITSWPLQGAEAHFPMALDETHHRLFVGVRTPPLLMIVDTESGQEVARVKSVGDADDLFYDAQHRRIYIAGGEGLLTIVAQEDANRYTSVATIPTASGARTALFVPELGRLYLAVPHRGAQGAEVRVYAVQ